MNTHKFSHSTHTVIKIIGYICMHWYSERDEPCIIYVWYFQSINNVVKSGSWMFYWKQSSTKQCCSPFACECLWQPQVFRANVLWMCSPRCLIRPPPPPHISVAAILSCLRFSICFFHSVRLPVFSMSESMICIAIYEFLMHDIARMYCAVWGIYTFVRLPEWWNGRSIHQKIQTKELLFSDAHSELHFFHRHLNMHVRSFALAWFCFLASRTCVILDRSRTHSAPNVEHFFVFSLSAHSAAHSICLFLGSFRSPCEPVRTRLHRTPLIIWLCPNNWNGSIIIRSVHAK